MQSAESVLGIIRERGRKGLPLERLYRCLFNPDLYLLAYGRIYRNDGAMTPGATAETVDGMRLGKIQAIIDALRSERYRWSPTRRVYIEKKGNTKKRRGLGLPTWSDKLLQEVMRLLLEAYYEPQFSAHSHGFRPGRGVTPRCKRSIPAGGVRPGSSRATSKPVSTVRTTVSCGRFWQRRSMTTASCGWLTDCSRPDIWKIGAITRR